MKTTIYTNGKSLFTLENYDTTAGVNHTLNITLYSIVPSLKARAMHEKGSLHYIIGIGDRKEISNLFLNRNLKFKNFIIS